MEQIAHTTAETFAILSLNLRSYPGWLGENSSYPQFKFTVQCTVQLQSFINLCGIFLPLFNIHFLFIISADAMDSIQRAKRLGNKGVGVVLLTNLRVCK
jgi:hypothetical protein